MADTPISIRIDENDKEILQAHAKEEGLSMSQVIRKAIKEYLEARKLK